MSAIDIPSTEDSARFFFRDLQEEIHDNAVKKGFWEANKDVGMKLALIHSEISEALEEFRSHDIGNLPHVYYAKAANPKPEGFGVELADAVIRIMDLCQYFKIDLLDIVLKKHHYNLSRPHLHGGKRA